MEERGARNTAGRFQPREQYCWRWLVTLGPLLQSSHSHTQTSYAGTRELIQGRAGFARYNCLFTRSIVTRRRFLTSSYANTDSKTYSTSRGWLNCCEDAENCFMLLSWQCPFNLKKGKWLTLKYKIICRLVPLATPVGHRWTLPLKCTTYSISLTNYKFLGFDGFIL